jgi:two-component system nitrogen regulation response regulator GlnG
VVEGSATSVAAAGVAVVGECELGAGEIDDGVVLLLANRIVLLLSLIDPLGRREEPSLGLVGESAPLLALRREIRRVAPLDGPVLVSGETGVGKELVATALHAASGRAHKPFLAVNMGALSPTLAAAELFGSLRGAFSGAERPRTGLLRSADGGTLFLDEIGETPPEVQVMLLRALETREILPLGSDEPVRVNVRLIAATDASLQDAVHAGRFRAPLLHRLAGYEIRVPPLRQRREDFGRLLLAFLRSSLAAVGDQDRLSAATGGKPWLPAPLVARLAAFDWPGNIRQLKNAVQRLVAAGRDGGEPAMWLQAEQILQEAVRVARKEDSNPTGAPAAPATPALTAPSKPARKSYRSPEEVSDDELLAALRANRWRIQRAAAQLGISRGSLYDRIDKSTKIRKAADLSRREIEECFAGCGGELDAMVERLEVSKRGLQRRMTQLGMGEGSSSSRTS